MRWIVKVCAQAGSPMWNVFVLRRPELAVLNWCPLKVQQHARFLSHLQSQCLQPKTWIEIMSFVDWKEAAVFMHFEGRGFGKRLCVQWQGVQASLLTCRSQLSEILLIKLLRSILYSQCLWQSFVGWSIVGSAVSGMWIVTWWKLELLLNYSLCPQRNGAENPNKGQSQGPEDELPRVEDERRIHQLECRYDSNQAYESLDSELQQFTKPNTIRWFVADTLAIPSYTISEKISFGG